MKNPGTLGEVSGAQVGTNDNWRNYSQSTAPSIPADRLLSRLDGVRCVRSGQFIARCPAHGDRSPSLSIRETDTGALLVHCFAGCRTDDVLAAVGLSLADLFPGNVNSRPAGIPAARRRDLAEAELNERLVLAAVCSDIERGEALAPGDIQRAGIAIDRLKKIRGMLRHG